MRNITFLSILVIIIFIFSTVSPVIAQETKERSYGFSFGGAVGFVYGKSSELVYPISTKGELLSELLWDINSIFYFDIYADFGRKDLMSGLGLFASVSFKLGIPGYSGIIEDRDWMSTANSNLTHFSSHKNITNEFYWADIAIGLSIPVKSWFYITPFLSGSWMRFSFTGKDGYAKYARLSTCKPDCNAYVINGHTTGCVSNVYSSLYDPINDNPHYLSFEGDVIRYRQDWLLAAAGFIIGTNILSPFLFELSFHISPLTYCIATDDHLIREDVTVFKDFTAWGLFLEPKSKVSFRMEKADFSIELSYRYISRTIGNGYVSYESLGKGFMLTSNKTGAGLSILNTRFLLKVRL